MEEMELEIKEKPQACGKSADNLFVRIWRLYYDGFRNMTIGRYLWALILVKLAIMFLVLKLFFFPNLLETNYSSDEERAQAVRENLIKN